MRLIIAVPVTCALVLRAWKKNSLTPAGLVAATLTAIAHAYHPWNLPFVLLCVFFLAGTRVTHIKEDVKSHLTMASKGSPAGEGPRTHVQVFANSLVASVLSVLHANQLRTRAAAFTNPHAPDPTGTTCFSWGGDLMVIGIIANYAAVAADTFSSELGILSKSDPRLITSLTLRKVPRGTNGGVTIVGLASGLLGSMIIVTVATLFLPMCNESTSAALGGGSPWLMSERRTFMASMVIWGAMGSILDSFLGGLFQRSVKDIRSGKIVQGEGGHRVLVSSSFGGLNLSSKAKSAIFHGEEKSAVGTTESVAVGDQGPNAKYDPKNKHRKPSFGDERPSRIVESGWDLLDNNDVNFLMAVIMSVGAMAGASWYWDVPVQNMLSI